MRVTHLVVPQTLWVFELSNGLLSDMSIFSCQESVGAGAIYYSSLVSGYLPLVATVCFLCSLKPIDLGKVCGIDFNLLFFRELVVFLVITLS